MRILRTISQEELKQILENHKHYIAEDIHGWETMKADLSRAKLIGADLSEAKLNYADLTEADLRGADLRGANLSLADLSEANLSGAKLRGADLRGADLRGANLSLADLSEAKLNYADLTEADLTQADLSEAKLSFTYLNVANLSDVDLRGAILMDADLSGAKLPNPEYMNSICPMVCPEKGAFIGWKTANVELLDEDGVPHMFPVIVKLQIPGRAKRSSATGRKCRCDKALVLDIWSLNGIRSSKGTVAYSRYDPTFTYEVGQKLYVANFDDDRWNECSTGIHFFMTRREAIDYAL